MKIGSAAAITTCLADETRGPGPDTSPSTSTYHSLQHIHQDIKGKDFVFCRCLLFGHFLPPMAQSLSSIAITISARFLYYLHKPRTDKFIDGQRSSLDKPARLIDSSNLCYLELHRYVLSSFSQGF